MTLIEDWKNLDCVIAARRIFVLGETPAFNNKINEDKIKKYKEFRTHFFDLKSNIYA